MPLSSAYLLVSHGSRDPRPQIAMETLAELIRGRLVIQHGTWKATPVQANRSIQRPNADQPAGSAIVVNSVWYPLVGIAALELAPAPLHEQIRQFASTALASGHHQVQLLPLFLLPGVHVMVDIPQEVTLALASLGQAVAIAQRPHLGTHPGLARILASQLVTLDCDTKILLSHGSRRREGNEPVEAVAEQLRAVAAYWSVQPMLEEQVQRLANTGHRRIAILPYFLFSGGITDAIAQRVAELQAQFPRVQLRLGEPLGASAELADMIVDLIED